MQRYAILWVDDEIDLLKSHILFLQQRGYDVTSISNAEDAIEQCKQKNFDVVFLDENMPGMSGLDALQQIKVGNPTLPIVMITKSEEEHIMEEAIGLEIDDYLIKPLNPNQILSSVKKILDNKRLVTEKTNVSYQQEFQKISLALLDDMDFTEWASLYRKLVRWELKLEEAQNSNMTEVLQMQKIEANQNFSNYIRKRYESWLNDPNVARPLLSHQLMKKKVFPEINPKRPVFFILIDNLRWDQWKMIEPLVADLFNREQEETYYSILPTATAYARNSIFSGLLPSEMAKHHPDWWVGDDEEEAKNNFEEQFLGAQLKRNNLTHKFSYHKIIKTEQGNELEDTLPNLFQNALNVIIYNFVDMLSHARTDMQMVRELAPDEAAYRSLTKSWFEHSSLYQVLKKISEKPAKIIITTDHGTVRVKKPIKIVGDRDVNTNLRYKTGKNLSYDADKIMVMKNPERFFLPKSNFTSTYVFAMHDQFFAYPNNYNYYVNYFRDTFQHGGISLEEMIIPLITLSSKVQ